MTANSIRESGLATALINYVDDFCGSVSTHPDFRRLRRILIMACSLSRVFAETKNDPALNTRVKSLGFDLDTDSLTIEVPARRKAKLRETARTLLAHTNHIRAPPCAN